MTYKHDILKEGIKKFFSKKNRFDFCNLEVLGCFTQTKSAMTVYIIKPLNRTVLVIAEDICIWGFPY